MNKLLSRAGRGANRNDEDVDDGVSRVGMWLYRSLRLQLHGQV